MDRVEHIIKHLLFTVALHNDVLVLEFIFLISINSTYSRKDLHMVSHQLVYNVYIAPSGQ